MNVLKVFWQHLFRKTDGSLDREGSTLSALKADFSAEPLSGEQFLDLMQEAGFEELVTEDGSLRFRFDGQEVKLEGDPEQFALQVSDLLLEFKPPSFYDEGLELKELDMQGLDEHFWEKYVFDEKFLKDVPNFTRPDLQSFPADPLTIIQEKE